MFCRNKKIEKEENILVKNCMIFCSNPVNGGTVRVFKEQVEGLRNLLYTRFNALKIYPCVNMQNDVEAYESIKNIIRIDVKGKEESLGESRKELNFFNKLFDRISRYFLYLSQRKQNKKMFIRFIEEHAIDCVMIHNGGYVGDCLCNELLEAAKKANVKKRIMIFHNDFEKNIIDKIRFLPYDLSMIRCSTDLITVSRFTKERIERNSLLKGINVIYNGLEEKSFQDLYHERKLVLDAKRKVLMIGNFLENKGQRQFIEMANHILGSGKLDCSFTIIGNIYDEHYYQECMKLVRDYRMMENIDVLTGILHAQEHIKNYDCLVVPSLVDESFGLVALEGIACGVPVIAFSCGGLPEVLENGGGVLVEVGYSEGLANAVESILLDSERYSSLSKKGRENYLAHFTRTKMLEKYVELLLQ